MLNRWRKVGFGVRPAGADRRDHRVRVPALLVAAPQAAARVAPVEDEVGEPLGMPRRVHERDRGALRDAEQREAIEARRRRRPPRGRRPTCPRRDRRARGRRGRTRARRSGRPCGRPPARRASGATPGSPSRSRGASTTSPPARSAVRGRGRRTPAGRHPQRCRSEPAAPQRRPYNRTPPPPARIGCRTGGPATPTGGSLVCLSIVAALALSSSRPSWRFWRSSRCRSPPPRPSATATDITSRRSPRPARWRSAPSSRSRAP